MSSMSLIGKTAYVIFYLHKQKNMFIIFITTTNKSMEGLWPLRKQQKKQLRK